MNNTEIIDDLIKQLEDLKKYHNTDIGDIGNITGIVIGKYICNEIGFDKESFMHGLNHGFLLADGTHP